MSSSAWWFPETLNQGLTSEPTEVRAGDTVKWSVSYASYPASGGWLLHYALNNGKRVITFDGTANGDQFDISVDTSDWDDGIWAFQSWVDTGQNTARYTVSFGQIKVLPDLTTDPVDSRSHNQRVLEAIYAILEGRGDEVTYTIGGRALTKMPRAELEIERRRYEWLVAREQGRAPQYFGAIFRRPS